MGCGDADRAIQEGSGKPALQAGYCMCQTTLGGWVTRSTWQGEDKAFNPTTKRPSGRRRNAHHQQGVIDLRRQSHYPVKFSVKTYLYQSIVPFHSYVTMSP